VALLTVVICGVGWGKEGRGQRKTLCVCHLIELVGQCSLLDIALAAVEKNEQQEQQHQEV